MTERPYVVLSCAISADGCLDDESGARLVFSGRADSDRVDGERAACDAIMVGAGTIRRDDPRLLVRSPERRAQRLARGLPANPAVVTLTASGDIDPAARFLSGRRPAGAAAERGRETLPRTLVYCASAAAGPVRHRLAGLAEVIDAGARPALGEVLADLSRQGVRRLLVEGGADLGRRFLTGGFVDELHLVIAPFFVGDAGAPRFAGPGVYPHGPSNPMILTEVRQVGEVVLLRYLLRDVAGCGAPGGPGEARRGAQVPGGSHD